jgi:hypothetical protein
VQAVTAKYPNFAQIQQDPALKQWLAQHPEMAAKAGPTSTSADTLAVLDAWTATRGAGSSRPEPRAADGGDGDGELPADLLALPVHNGLTVADMMKDAPEWVGLPAKIAPFFAERAVSEAIATGRVVSKSAFDQVISQIKAMESRLALIGEHPDVMQIERTAEFKGFLEARADTKAAWERGEHRSLILDAYKESATKQVRGSAERRPEAAARRSAVSASLQPRPTAAGKSAEKSFAEAFNESAT